MLETLLRFSFSPRGRHHIKLRHRRITIHTTYSSLQTEGRCWVPILCLCSIYPAQPLASMLTDKAEAQDKQEVIRTQLRPSVCRLAHITLSVVGCAQHENLILLLTQAQALDRYAMPRSIRPRIYIDFSSAGNKIRVLRICIISALERQATNIGPLPSLSKVAQGFVLIISIITSTPTSMAER